MVSLLLKKTAAKVGVAPGTSMHIGEQRIDQVRLRVILVLGRRTGDLP